MKLFEPYTFDNELYAHKVPQGLRWCFNKLTLSERLGYKSGPVGTSAPGGEMLIRPIMNMAGMAEGGVFPFNVQVVRGAPVNSHIPMRDFPGYFWCERFPGPLRFSEYIDDTPIASTTGEMQEDIMHFEETTDHIEIPNILKGLSRYLLIEAMGDKVVEVSLRHISSCARQHSIDDYRQFVPDYDPTHVQFGFVDMKKIPYGQGGYRWEEYEPSRRPWVLAPD